MKSEPDQKLEQLRFEARIEQLLREKNQAVQIMPELEKFTKRILNLRVWSFQLEVRRWVRP